MTCRGNCNQSRRDCPHPVQCQSGKVEQTLTDWGLLAEAGYDERDDSKAGLMPISRGERLVLWLIVSLSVAGVGSMVVSCVN